MNNIIYATLVINKDPKDKGGYYGRSDVRNATFDTYPVFSHTHKVKVIFPELPHAAVSDRLPKYPRTLHYSQIQC